MQGAEGGDGSGKGGRGLHSKLRPTSGSQVLNHDPQSGVVLVPKVCSANSPFPPGTALLHAQLHLVCALSTLHRNESEAVHGLVSAFKRRAARQAD